MSIELLERAAEDLAPFLDDLVFVGGATITLWMTDPAAPAPRPTKDVDVVVEVASRGAWHDFEARLRAHGLQPDAASPVICRWRGTDGELLLDVMPSDASLLGFENRWQGARARSRCQALAPVSSVHSSDLATLPLGDEARGVERARSRRPSAQSRPRGHHPSRRRTWRDHRRGRGSARRPQSVRLSRDHIVARPGPIPRRSRRDRGRLRRRIQWRGPSGRRASAPLPAARQRAMARGATVGQRAPRISDELA